MAELHIIGEISHGEGFPGHSYFCTYEFISGVNWKHVEGRIKGSTQITQTSPECVAWSVPIDVHYAFMSAQGWPRISVQVWCVDWYGRKDLAGYGVCYIPLPSSSLEQQTVEIHTWKPTYWHPNFLMRGFAQFRQMLMGGNPVLRDDVLIHTNENRFKLHTVSGGTVILHLSVVSRNAQAAGLKMVS